MKHIHIELETYDTLDTLSHADRALVEAALDRLGTGHAPYSQFHVSAACQSADGQVWIGTNQENASYPAETNTTQYMSEPSELELNIPK